VVSHNARDDDICSANIKRKTWTEATIHENEGLEGGGPYSELIPTKNMIIINENAYLYHSKWKIWGTS
jgi:hypothetical protein